MNFFKALEFLGLVHRYPCQKKGVQTVAVEERAEPLKARVIQTEPSKHYILIRGEEHAVHFPDVVPCTLLGDTYHEIKKEDRVNIRIK